jgi:hypothetical protein
LVVAVRLANNGIRDTASGAILGLSFPEVIDLSNNDITFFTGLTGIKQSLDTLDVRNNRLGFETIAFNATRSAFVFNPQRPLSDGREIFVPFNTPGGFNSGTNVSDNRYVWTKNGTRLNVPSSQQSFSFPQSNRPDRGVYRATVTNPRVPDFSLESGPITFLPFASATGQLAARQDTLVGGGVVALERLQFIDTAGVAVPGRFFYDTVAVANLFPIEEPENEGGRNGRTQAQELTYRFDTLPVGSYTFLGVRFSAEDFETIENPIDTVVVADTLLFESDNTFLPTYYTEDTAFAEAALTWTDADTVNLNRDLTGLDIFMVPFPDEDIFQGVGEIRGTVFFQDGQEPLEEEINSRVKRRRRSRRSSVRISQRLLSRRDEQEFEFRLILIANTDEQGEYRFADLAPGVYRVEVEIPGFLNNAAQENNRIFRVDPARALEAEYTQEANEVTRSLDTFEPEILLSVLNPDTPDKVYIYPNPAALRVFMPLESIKDANKIELYDLNGVKVLEQFVTEQDILEGRSRVELPGIESGMYIIQLLDAQGKRQFSDRLMIER